MKTISRLRAVAPLALAILLAACTGGGGSPAASSQPPASSAASAAPSITPVPVPSDSGSAGDGSASNPGDSGSGVLDPGTGTDGLPAAEPSIVAPVPGTAAIHDIQATKLTAAVNGRDVAIRVEWWSGVEPCNVLAAVKVDRSGDTFKLTVREGSAAAPDTMCVEIAVYKGTVVDLGQLDPGTYTVTAFGTDVQPIQVTVS